MKTTELNMIEEMKKALNEKGHNYIMANDGTLIVNPNEKNGLMFYIEVYKETLYRFTPNIMKMDDPEIQQNYKRETFNIITAEEIIGFIEWCYKQYPDWMKEIRSQLGLTSPLSKGAKEKVKIEKAITTYHEVLLKKYKELAIYFGAEFENDFYDISQDYDGFGFYTTFEDETERFKFKITPTYNGFSLMIERCPKNSEYPTGSGKVFEHAQDAVAEIKKSIDSIKRANEFIPKQNLKYKEIRAKFPKELSDDEMDILLDKHALIFGIDKLNFDENEIESNL